MPPYLGGVRPQERSDDRSALTITALGIRKTSSTVEEPAEPPNSASKARTAPGSAPQDAPCYCHGG